MPEAKGLNLNTALENDDSFLVVTRLKPRERPFVSVRRQRIAQYCLEAAARRRRVANATANKKRVLKEDNGASRPATPAAAATTKVQKQELLDRTPFSLQYTADSGEVVDDALSLWSDDVKFLFPPRNMVYSSSNLTVDCANPSWNSEFSKNVTSSSDSAQPPLEGSEHDVMYRSTQERQPSSPLERPRRPMSRAATHEAGDRLLNQPIIGGHVLSSATVETTTRADQHRRYKRIVHARVWDDRLEIARDDRTCSDEKSSERLRVERKRGSSEKDLKISTSNSESIYCTKVIKYSRGTYQTGGTVPPAKGTYHYRRARPLRSRLSPSRAARWKRLPEDAVCRADDQVKLSDGRRVKARQLEFVERKRRLSEVENANQLPGEESSGERNNRAPSGIPRDHVFDGLATSTPRPYCSPLPPHHSYLASTGLTRPRFSVPIKASRTPMDVLYRKKFSGQFQDAKPRVPPVELQSYGPRNPHSPRYLHASLRVTTPLKEVARAPVPNQKCLLCQNPKRSTRPTVRFLLPQKNCSECSHTSFFPPTPCDDFSPRADLKSAVNFPADSAAFKSVVGNSHSARNAGPADICCSTLHSTSVSRSMARFLSHINRLKKPTAAFRTSNRHLREPLRGCLADAGQSFGKSPGELHNVSARVDRFANIGAYRRKVVAHDRVPHPSHQPCKPALSMEPGAQTALGTSSVTPTYNNGHSKALNARTTQSIGSQRYAKSPHKSSFKGSAPYHSHFAYSSNYLDEHKSYFLQLSNSLIARHRLAGAVKESFTEIPIPQELLHQNKAPVRFRPSMDFSHFTSPPSPYPCDRSFKESSGYNGSSLGNNMAPKPPSPAVGLSKIESCSSSYSTSTEKSILSFSGQVPSETMLPSFEKWDPDPLHNRNRGPSAPVKNATFQVSVETPSANVDRTSNPCLNYNKNAIVVEKSTPMRGEQKIESCDEKRLVRNNDRDTNRPIRTERCEFSGNRLVHDAILPTPPRYSSSVSDRDYAHYSDVNWGREYESTSSTSNLLNKHASGLRPSEELRSAALNKAYLPATTAVKRITMSESCTDKHPVLPSDSEVQERKNPNARERKPYEQENNCCAPRCDIQLSAKAVRFGEVEKACDIAHFTSRNPKIGTEQPEGKKLVTGTDSLQSEVPESVACGILGKDCLQNCPATEMTKNTCTSSPRNLRSDINTTPSQSCFVDLDKPSKDAVTSKLYLERKRSTKPNTELLNSSNPVNKSAFDETVRRGFLSEANSECLQSEESDQLSQNFSVCKGSPCFPPDIINGQYSSPEVSNQYPDAICLTMKSEGSQAQQNEAVDTSDLDTNVTSQPPIASTTKFQTYEVCVGKTQFVDVSTQVPIILCHSVETNTYWTGRSLLLSSLSFRLEPAIDVPPVNKETESIATCTEGFPCFPSIGGDISGKSIPARTSTLPENAGVRESKILARHNSPPDFNACIKPVVCTCRCSCSALSQAPTPRSVATRIEERHEDLEQFQDLGAFFHLHRMQLANVCAIAMIPVYEQAIESRNLVDNNARMKKRTESRHAGKSGHCHHPCKHEQRGKPARQPVHDRHGFVRAFRRECDYVKSGRDSAGRLKGDDRLEVHRESCENLGLCNAAAHHIDSRQSSGVTIKESCQRGSVIQKLLTSCDVPGPTNSEESKGKHDSQGISNDTTFTRKCRRSKLTGKIRLERGASFDSETELKRVGNSVAPMNSSCSCSKKRDKGNPEVMGINTTKDNGDANCNQSLSFAEISSSGGQPDCSLWWEACKNNSKERTALRKKTDTCENPAEKQLIQIYRGASESIETCSCAERRPAIRQAEYTVFCEQSAEQTCGYKTQVKNASNANTPEKCFWKELHCIENSTTLEDVRETVAENVENDVLYQEEINENVYPNLEHRQLSVILEKSSDEFDRSPASEDELCHVISALPDFDNSAIYANCLAVTSEASGTGRLPKIRFTSASEVCSEEENDCVFCDFNPVTESHGDLTCLQGANVRSLANDNDGLSSEPTTTILDDISADHKGSCKLAAKKRYVSHHKRCGIVDVEENSCKQCGRHAGAAVFQGSSDCAMQNHFHSDGRRWFIPDSQNDSHTHSVDFLVGSCEPCLSKSKVADSCASYRRTSNVVGVAAINPLQPTQGVLYEVSENVHRTERKGRAQSTQESHQQVSFPSDQEQRNTSISGFPNDQDTNSDTLDGRKSFSSKKCDPSFESTRSNVRSSPNGAGRMGTNDKKYVPRLVDALVFWHHAPHSLEWRTSRPKSPSSSSEELSTCETCPLHKQFEVQAAHLDAAHEPHFSTSVDTKTFAPYTRPCGSCNLVSSDGRNTESDVEVHQETRKPRRSGRERLSVGIPECERKVNSRKCRCCESGSTRRARRQDNCRKCEGGTCRPAVSSTFDSQGNLRSLTAISRQSKELQRGPRKLRSQLCECGKCLERL